MASVFKRFKNNAKLALSGNISSKNSSRRLDNNGIAGSTLSKLKFLNVFLNRELDASKNIVRYIKSSYNDVQSLSKGLGKKALKNDIIKMKKDLLRSKQSILIFFNVIKSNRIIFNNLANYKEDERLSKFSFIAKQKEVKDNILHFKNELKKIKREFSNTGKKELNILLEGIDSASDEIKRLQIVSKYSNNVDIKKNNEHELEKIRQYKETIKTIKENNLKLIDQKLKRLDDLYNDLRDITSKKKKKINSKIFNVICRDVIDNFEKLEQNMVIVQNFKEKAYQYVVSNISSMQLKGLITKYIGVYDEFYSLIENNIKLGEKLEYISNDEDLSNIIQDKLTNLSVLVNKSRKTGEKIVAKGHGAIKDNNDIEYHNRLDGKTISQTNRFKEFY